MKNYVFRAYNFCSLSPYIFLERRKLMKRKNLFIAASFLVTAALAACGGSGKKKEEAPDLTGDYQFEVWCAELAVTSMTAQLESFKATLPEGCNVTFEVNPVGEGAAAGNMLTDVESGADIYCFAQDQLARLVTAGALDRVTGTVKDEVSARNDAGSVKAGTHKGNLYAFPLTSDNGYFMYYDKSVINESSLGDISKILADAKAKDKFVYYNAADGWYGAAYFFGAGCESVWTQNDDESWTIESDTYNSDKGVIAAKGVAEIVNHSNWVGGSDAGTAFGSNGAVCISGTWDYNAAKSKLGDNFACAELPSFTVGGKSYHMGSFSGNKLVGVKPQSGDKKVQRTYLAKQIASYITNEENQLARFNNLGWGPSNLNAQQNDAVKANPALVAFNNQAKYATPQGQFPDGWWPAAAAIATDLQKLETATPTDAQIKTVLDNYTAAINAIE